MCTWYSTICCIQPTTLHENNDDMLIVYNFPLKFNMNLCHHIWDCIFKIFFVTEGRGRFLLFLFKNVGKGEN